MEPSTSKPYVKIVEQPAPDRARFRYQSEGFSTILGVSSTVRQKTYPTIQIFGYTGKAVVIMSCVTKDEPYRPHPFNIDGKQGCKKGVCTLTIPENSNTVEFRNVGIKCVKKNDVVDSLKERQLFKIDPFKTGIDLNPSSYDLGSVRLCFQVFLEGENGKCRVPIAPVVSDPIYDRKNIPDLIIYKISHCVCRVDEEAEIIILCGKISADNIQVRFYEEHNGVLVWEAFGVFRPSEIHRQVAVTFRAPKYYNMELENPTRVLVQLRRPIDKATSQPIPFEYIPSDEIGRKRKKPRIDSLLDLARCFDNCGYNPFGKIRKEKVATRRLQPTPPPNTFSANIPSNMPSASGTPYPMNIPYDVYTVQPGPSKTNFQNDMQNNYPVNPENASYKPSQERVDQQGGNFDFAQFSSALYNSLQLGDLPGEANQNMTDSLTRLARDTIDSFYQDSNYFI